MIKVLIVDDSRTARAALRAILERDSEILVVGEASTSHETMALIHRFDPHFVTMDIYLGPENGLDLTRRIMTEAPRPILVITGVSPNDPELGYQAIERGALDVFPKPPGPMHSNYATQSAKLVRLVKTLSKVPVLHQRRRKSVTVHPPIFTAPFEKQGVIVTSKQPIDLLLIGASTGGPPVISGVLERLKRPCPIPIVVIQHITSGFAAGFSDWLSHTTGHPTHLVNESVSLRSGTVYIPMDDTNLVFTSANIVRAVEEPNTRGPKPNIDRLFLSAAKHSRARTLALVLTGMGSDGAEGLAALKSAGATVAVQEPSSCAVDSMPRSALAGGASICLTPAQMVLFIDQRLSK